MRPTNASQRSRSRLAGLSAEPAQVVRDHVPDPDPGLPEDPVPESRGPSAPAWLAEPEPPMVLGLRSREPDPERPEEPPSRIAAWVPQRWRGARFAISGRGLLVLAILGLVAAAIAGVGVARDRPASVPVPALASPPSPVASPVASAVSAPSAAPSANPVAGPAAVPEEIVVSVQGLVGTSGLVRLEPGARVADALSAAGGALEGADLRSLNLAQKLVDGDQVLVGVEPTDGGPPRLGSATVGAGGAAAGGAAAGGSGTGGPGAGGPGAGGSTSGTVNLNTATAGELDALPGVGPVTAQAIMDWRAENGRFASVDQLAEVRGIGPARLASLRELVTV